MADPISQAQTYQTATLEMMREGGRVRMPIDSGQGQIYRPLGRQTGDGRIATFETLYDFWLNNVDDPDTALAKDPNFDERLRQNPDVHAAATIRELTVAKMPWKIQASDSEGVDPRFADEVSQYVEAIFKSLNMVELYAQMQTAVLMGGVGHEWVWHREANGVCYPVQYWMVKKDRFLFDRLGNMARRTRFNPVWGMYVNANPDVGFRYRELGSGDHAVYFPRGKFSYHKYRIDGGTWTRPAEEGYLYYGRGEDTRLYTLVTFGGFAWRFWIKWLEKYGIPPTDIYYPQNQSTPSSVLEIATSVRGDSVTTIPRVPGDPFDSLWSIKTREVPNLSFDAFRMYLDEYNGPKIRAILLGSGEEIEKGDTGGYSDHVSRRDAGPQILFGHDAMRISETINTQLIPLICEYRWPKIPARYFPKHVMEAKEEKDSLQLMEVIEKAATLVEVRKSDVYEAAQLEPPGENEETVFNGQPSPEDDPMGFLMGGGNPMPGKPGGGAGGGGKPGQPGQPQQKGGIGQGKQHGAGALGGGKAQPDREPT